MTSTEPNRVPDLQARSRRPTRQHLAVAALLSAIDDFRSAQEIHDMLRHQGQKVGLTTVYRSLQRMSEEGSVDSVRTADGESLFRRCSSGHHHHLLCRECGHTVEVAGPDVERWAQQISGVHGFTRVSHTVEIFGTCADCTSGP